MSISDCLGHLQALVAFDTQNPPRRIDGDSEIFSYCSELLPAGFRTRIWDHGDGHVSWFAVRGNPRVLFNVHVDTVPSGDGWSADPLQMQVVDEKAYGRGTCDIKGAAAALLTLAEQGAENLALLLTSDEEGAGGCCVERFIEAGEAERFGQVVVAEPTSCLAVLAHRGYLSVKGRFHGTPGHSSEARALDDSAIHGMALWAAAALEVARARKVSAEDPGSCFNIGLIAGGTKSNVIAGDGFVHWSARLAPGESNRALQEAMAACVPAGVRAEWEVPFSGNPLPAGGRDSESAGHFCRRAELKVGDPVDFWTEASLFSAAGLPALVLGPGHISQAHQTDEWVSLQQLQQALDTYAQLVKRDG